jgi:hypothetical protein
MPRSASKAGSTLPPLADRTAFTTERSIEGKASVRVFSACSLGLRGLAGFAGGGGSSDDGSAGEAEAFVVFLGALSLGLEVCLDPVESRSVFVLSFLAEDWGGCQACQILYDRQADTHRFLMIRHSITTSTEIYWRYHRNM